MLSKAIKAYEHLRSGIYFIESLPLIAANLLVKEKERHQVTQADVEYLKQSVGDLFEFDSKCIEDKIYPVSVLTPKKPLTHLSTLGKVYADAVKVIFRKIQRKTKSFSKDAQRYAEDLPEYYKRNFHFQTDGYLSQNSAEIYDHQVELLFKGTSQAMRRIFLKDLKQHLQNYKTSGKLHFLEIAVGTGSATEFVVKAFPEAKITCIDLSDAYLKKAQENLKDYSNINFLQAEGENLPFKNETFDAVFSVYLFHELPKEVRKKVIEESIRVLKTSGYMGIVDSIQMNDDEKLNWAIRDFPKDFHEPFYKNYIETSMESLVPTMNTELIGKRVGFLTKALSYRKL